MHYNLHSYFPVLSSLQPHRVWQEDRPARSLHSEVRSSVGKISGQLHLRTMDRAFDCSKGNHFELTTIVVKLYQLTHSCSMKPCECIFSHYRGITVSHLQYLTSNILKTKLTIIPENFHVEKRGCESSFIKYSIYLLSSTTVNKGYALAIVHSITLEIY